MNEKSNAQPPLKITLVTPNYNGGKFLEETILSVVTQDYPNLEYIFVDGASSDDSMIIVERYAQHFSHIISEKDEGHADAINKGFSRASGDIMAWINSDDLLLPGSLKRVNQAFSKFPDVAWLTGRPSTVNISGQFGPLLPLRMWSWIRFLCGDFRHIQQESTFWRRSLWEAAGARLDMRYLLANDFNLWLRFFQRTTLYTIDASLGCFRMRSGQRSIAQAADYERECKQALEEFIDAMPAALLARHFSLMPSEQLRSWRTKPKVLPSDLAATDPPLITVESSTGHINMAAFENRDIPLDFKPDVTIEEDMIFDGFDRIVWSSGPQLSEHNLAAAEIELVPFAPNVTVPGGMSEISPPIVALVGPLAISDQGNGKMVLNIRFHDGVARHDLQLSDADRRYRVKLLLSADRYALFLDGRTVAVEPTKGRQVMQSPFVVLGGGHAQRFWVGAVQQLAVTVLSRPQAGKDSQIPRTYLLTHRPGALALPREQRAHLPPVTVKVRKPAERATPLTAFRNRHRGQRCFVMGNGPSLNKMDLEKLVGEVVFACNAAFLLFDRVSWRPTYYTCVDTRVIRDRAIEIQEMLDAYPALTAFFPVSVHLHDGSGTVYEARQIIPPGPNRFYFNEIGNRESNHPETMFSLDADDYVVQPYTVAITMLQLAAFMGFSEIYLIGCDTSYKVQETVKQEGRAIDGVGLLLTSTRDDDANHFDPRYFGRGREWHNPQVNKMINHYRWAQLALRRTNTRVFNATVGGQLEVFPRVDLNTIFTQGYSSAAIDPVPARKYPLLSIAMPAYNRPGTLMYAIERFIEQIAGRFEDDVEIVVSDDCSPNDSLRPVRMLADKHRFIRYRRYKTNIGLERNLLECADDCRGDYLWVFGDDDFLMGNDALEKILCILTESQFDVIVLNRARLNTDLSQVLSPNWMGLDPDLRKTFPGLREFCLQFGFISVLGFISVNIFRRRLYQRIDAKKYMGTMYPQLGALIEAFFDRPTLLIGTPLVCQRTQTAEEKRRALGAKTSEAAFMSNDKERNAIYFSHPYIAMLDELVSRGAFSREDLMQIRENTVIKGFLIDFLLDCICLSDELNTATDKQWARTNKFLSTMPLDLVRRAKIEPVLARHIYALSDWAGAHSNLVRRLIDAARKAIISPVLTRLRNVLPDMPGMNSDRMPRLTISVITPSFNQAAFLPDCLKSVRNQTYTALEHLVFDPGSIDESCEIAANFENITLIAEPDSGQSDALNKGFRQVRGDIIAWLNSDDMLFDDHVLERVVTRFSEPDAPDIVYGNGIYVDESGTKLRDAYINKDPSTLPWRLQQEDGIMQPALFMRRNVVDRVGPLRNDLHFSMDYEYWIRCVKAGIKFAYVDKDFAISRYHLNNKTYGQRGSSFAEVCSMTKENFGYVNHRWLKRYAEFLTEGHDGVVAHSANSGVRDRAKLDDIYRKLMREHNGDAKTIALLSERTHEKGYGETYREMQLLGFLVSDGCLSISLGTSEPLYGPFDRSLSAHYDETDCVAGLYSGTLFGNVMIDVGAHHGSALSKFLDKGWKIYAFEPDNNNRAKLLERIAKHKNKAFVTLDARCVSNNSQKGLSFYRSEQSTGISGLSAFHKSHIEAQRVDTVTLTEFFEGEPIPRVDFLKIDTEGHDYFVLQGYPWAHDKPAVIECEFEDTKTIPLGYTFHDLARFLVGKGYTVYVSEWHPIIRYGIRHDWNRLVRYPCELSNSKCWGNLLAFRDPIDEENLITAVHKVIKINGNNPVPVREVQNSDRPQIDKTARINQEITMKIHDRLRNLYISFAEWTRDNNPMVFRTGQFIKRLLRFIKRNAILMTTLIVVAFVLIIFPIIVRLEPNDLITWYFSGLFITMVVLAVIGARTFWLLRLQSSQLSNKQGQLSSKQDQLSSKQDQLSSKQDQLSSKQDQLSSKQDQLSSKQDQLFSKQDQLSSKQDQLSSKQDQLFSKQDQLSSKQDQLLSNFVFNSSDFQSFNRHLRKEHVDIILNEWMDRLSLKLPPRSLAYLAHRICTLEQICKGRIATTIENMVLRILVSSAVKRNKLRVLEIGTLFGIGLAAIYEYCRPRFEEVRLTAIDPLDGYYGKGARDILTDEPISEATFRSNFEIAGISEDEYCLISAMSSETRAIEEAMLNSYDVLIIDGDHTYEGVKADFEYYWKAVNCGGYIIFDDYDSPEWPDIKKYVDEIAVTLDGLIFVGASFRSAVFKVV